VSWKKTIFYSAGLSFAFFLFFAHLVADKWSIWAIHEAAPLLQTIRAEYGHPYSHAVGHSIAFAIGVIATAAFIFPIRYAFPSATKIATSALIITFPVALVSAAGADLSLAGVASTLQPIVGAALVVIPLFLTRASRGQS
jgi:hypothetical protein